MQPVLRYLATRCPGCDTVEIFDAAAGKYLDLDDVDQLRLF